MTEFQSGQKIIVREFTGKVIGASSYDACIQVLDNEGYTHYVFSNQVLLLPPYVVGRMYADDTGYGIPDEMFTFVKNDNGTYGWSRPADGREEGEDAFVFAYDYPTRPMRLIGEPIEDDETL